MIVGRFPRLAATCQRSSSTSVYFLSTWACCAQPPGSSRKWRQGGDGGSQFHSGFPLDYKLILTGPLRLFGDFCTAVSPRSASQGEVALTRCLTASGPAAFSGGIFFFLSKVQGGHPVELAVARRLKANVIWYAASSRASLSTSCVLRCIPQQSSCSRLYFDHVHVRLSQ